MGIFENLFKKKATEDVKIVNQAEVDKHVNYVGNMRYVPGHSIFEYNPNTGMLSKVDYETKEVFTPKVVVTKRKIKTTEGCMYVQALNMKNAKKKILKTINEINKLGENE